MRKPIFTKTVIQMLSMSLLGLVIIVAMSLYVGSSIRAESRGPASHAAADH